MCSKELEFGVPPAVSAAILEVQMNVVRIILLVLQMISCVALTAIILLQSGKENGLGALAGNSDNYMGKKAGTLDAKLARWTKWVAAAFVLLTLVVSMLYTASV